VRHLDRRLVAAGVPVEREQPGGTEAVRDPVHRIPIHIDRRDLRPGHSPAHVLGTLSGRQEPEEELSRRGPFGVG
jgi:hypothetical protein